ncbi:hypothetical protein C8J56DRAFT_1061234 [Mycena floridula]|nr:hypothetical protein C8J56DRAFT_1061234 [Mycena floridula]
MQSFIVQAIYLFCFCKRCPNVRRKVLAFLKTQKRKNRRRLLEMEGDAYLSEFTWEWLETSNVPEELYSSIHHYFKSNRTLTTLLLTSLCVGRGVSMMPAIFEGKTPADSLEMLLGAMGKLGLWDDIRDYIAEVMPVLGRAALLSREVTCRADMERAKCRCSLTVSAPCAWCSDLGLSFPLLDCTLQQSLVLTPN